MKCPNCGVVRMKVTDSRPTGVDGAEYMIRRRRCCLACGFRCSTYEVMGDTLDTETGTIIKLARAREALARLIRDALNITEEIDRPALRARATVKRPPEWVR